MSEQPAVPVTAEWALWGSDPDSAGYGVLAHSEGTFSAGHFGELVSRYEPGTLDKLPQVTIGWLREGEAHGNLLSLAIHDQAGSGDAAGRRARQTRLFCVPYDRLAAGAVSYSTLYQALDSCVLPTPGRRPISAELPGASQYLPAGNLDPLARRAAALLLTCKPVRILGGELMSLADRLGFIDSVAAFLPYGLRSRLSASTWVSGTLASHYLRLFFTSGAGQSTDPGHCVHLGEPAGPPVTDVTAAEYLKMLEHGGIRPRRLARHATPVEFRPDDLGTMLASIGSLASVEAVIRACAASLDSDPARLPAQIGLLRGHLAEPRSPGLRRRYAELVGELGLLRPSSSMRVAMLADLYAVLIELACVLPLDYLGYCEIEEWAGQPAGTRPSEALSRAMRRVALRDLPRLLVLALSDRGNEQAPTYRDLPPQAVVEAAAYPGLLPGHVRAICELIGQDRLGQPSRRDRQALREALSERGYLAPLLQESFPDELGTQLSLLAGLLRAAYGRKLTGAEGQEVLGAAHGNPTAALTAATLQEVEQQDVGQVTGQFPATFVNAPRAASTAAGPRPSEPPRSDPAAGTTGRTAKRKPKARTTSRFPSVAITGFIGLAAVIALLTELLLVSHH